MWITGAELFVKALKEEGVKTLFAYPGGSAIDLFDALYGQKDIDVVLPRHEQALVHAADGYARSTGKVGVCLVTSGPGATNLVTGIATANYDSVPLVCFTGQVPTSLIGNDAFQEVDTVGIVRNICKYAVTVRKREDLGRIIHNAFYIAKSGKPGVVVVDIPKDIQLELGSDEIPKEIHIRGYNPNTSVHIGQVNKALEVVEKAKRPVFLLGGGINVAHANEKMTELVEKMGMPVITTIMGKGAIPTNHELYVGNLGIHGSYAANTAISKCDVLFSIGTRFNDRITGKIEKFANKATIIHVDIDPASISRNISVNIPIVGDANNAIEALLKRAKHLDIDEWRQEVTAWRDDFPITMKTEENEKNNVLTPEYIIKAINRNYKNAIITTDVGQNQLWTTQYIEIDENKRLLTSGGLGTMGYGLPSAIGAKIGCPHKEVVSINGDGGIQMNIQELATAVSQELPITICIFNNGYLGNVRQWQEMFYNKRYSLTCLKYTKSCKRDCANCTNKQTTYTPDFVKLAQSYGAKGIRVFKREEVVEAFKEAKKNKTSPTIIEFIIPENLNVLPMVQPGNTLDDMVMEKGVK